MNAMKVQGMLKSNRLTVVAVMDVRALSPRAPSDMLMAGSGILLDEIPTTVILLDKQWCHSLLLPPTTLVLCAI